MKRILKTILLCVFFAIFFNIQTVKAQEWTFPYPTEGAACEACVPLGWTMVFGTPDISNLDGWAGIAPHYLDGGVASPVPEPVPGATTFMTAMAFGGGEEVMTSFFMTELQTITIYFGGFGTNWDGSGPDDAEPGQTENVLVNGVSVSIPIPWDGEWHPITYDLIVGTNTITFAPSLADDDNRHGVSIYISANQITPCNEELITTVSETDICLGDELTLSAESVSGAVVTWDMGVENGESFIPADTGIITYTATSDNEIDCQYSVEITIHELPPVDAGLDFSVCIGDPVTLAGAGADAGGVYVWTDGVSDGAEFVPDVTTTYTVTGTDESGCFSSDELIVTVNPLPNVLFSAIDLADCAPFNVAFNSPSAGLIYDWDFGDDTNGATASPSHSYTSSGLFDVTLTITSAEGCTSSLTYFEYITVYPLPIPAFSINYDELADDNSSTTFENNSLYATTYEWTFGDGSASVTEHSPMHTFPATDGVSYSVWLVAKNEFGCVDSTEKIINMKAQTIYYIPNSFTPDGDSFNEEFLPVFTSGIDIYDFHMTIYNRWGEIVFETYNLNYGWNGAYGDTGLVQDGTFIWQIEFGVLSSDARETHHGHVTVVK